MNRREQTVVLLKVFALGLNYGTATGASGCEFSQVASKFLAVARPPEYHRWRSRRFDEMLGKHVDGMRSSSNDENRFASFDCVHRDDTQNV